MDIINSEIQKFQWTSSTKDKKKLYQGNVIIKLLQTCDKDQKYLKINKRKKLCYA